MSAGFGPILGMSLVSGRWFNEIDTPGLVVINESLALRDFAGRDPIGARIRSPYGGPDAYATIVGVARDLKYMKMDDDAAPELFFSHRDTNLFSIMLVMKTDGDPLSAAPALRAALVDPVIALRAE